MEIGTPVRLKARHLFRGGQPDLSDSVGIVGNVREEDGRELVTVVFHEHQVCAPDVPAELFEITHLC